MRQKTLALAAVLTAFAASAFAQTAATASAPTAAASGAHKTHDGKARKHEVPVAHAASGAASK